MSEIYDQIGRGYSVTRQTDPRVAKQIYSQLAGAARIINIGAGAGSYEPEDIDLVAVEPSAEMISQRPKSAHPAVKASAEKLPFDDNSFTHAMTVLSMHHWQDKEQAFREINRVTQEKFIAVTWNPQSEPFWLTRDYFPEIYEIDKRIFPSVDDMELYFDELEIAPLMIPEDCIDGFLAAFWKRPEAYLSDKVRGSMSGFAKLKAPEKGLEKLRRDIANGEWLRKNEHILHQSFLDVGYVIISGKVKE